MLLPMSDPLPLSHVCSALQSKLGALFRPVLSLTHIREVEPPFTSPKQPLPPGPEAKPEALPSTAIVTITATAAAPTTSVSREIM